MPPSITATTVYLSVFGGANDDHYRIHSRSTTGEEEEVLVEKSERTFTLQDLVNQPQEPAGLRAIGERLFRFLFHENLEHIYRSALATAEAIASVERGGRLRLELVVAPEELAMMPWELLFDPVRERFLSAQARVSLSRRLMVLEPKRPQPRPSKLRVLGLFPETSGLRTTEERSALVSLSEERGLDLHCLDSQVTPEAVHIAMERFQPHIVHYSGHASYGEVPGLSLDRDRRRSLHLEATSFAQTFSHFGREPAVVVISACEGGLPGTRATRSVASALLRCGVLAVASMQTRIKDSRAALFCRTFYRTLSTSPTGDVEVAVSSSRSLMLTQRNHDPSFASPVLFLRGGRFELWPSETSAPLEKESSGFACLHGNNRESDREAPAQAHRFSMSGDGSIGEVNSSGTNAHIGHQYFSVSGDFYSSSRELVRSLEEIRISAIGNLEDRDYKAALVDLEEANRDVHQDHHVQYLLALSKLARRQPQGLRFSEIEEIEQHLLRAIRLSPKSHYMVFLAYLKHEFYVLNGLRERLPYVDSILSNLKADLIDRQAFMFLVCHLPVTSNNPALELIAHILGEANHTSDFD